MQDYGSKLFLRVRLCILPFLGTLLFKYNFIKTQNILTTGILTSFLINSAHVFGKNIYTISERFNFIAL